MNDANTSKHASDIVTETNAEKHTIKTLVVFITYGWLRHHLLATLVVVTFIILMPNLFYIGKRTFPSHVNVQPPDQ